MIYTAKNIAVVNFHLQQKIRIIIIDYNICNNLRIVSLMINV